MWVHMPDTIKQEALSRVESATEDLRTLLGDLFNLCPPPVQYAYDGITRSKPKVDTSNADADRVDQFLAGGTRTAHACMACMCPL